MEVTSFLKRRLWVHLNSLGERRNLEENGSAIPSTICRDSSSLVTRPAPPRPLLLRGLADALGDDVFGSYEDVLGGGVCLDGTLQTAHVLHAVLQWNQGVSVNLANDSERGESVALQFALKLGGSVNTPFVR